jgi:hypothetical protein
MKKTSMFATREGVGKEETILSYPRPILGEFISGIIGETIPYAFFPSPPSEYLILISI